MAREMKVDVTNAPELLRLAEQVRTSKQPYVLSRGDEPIAVVSPVTKRRMRGPTQADLAATLSSAGAWKGLVDAEALKQQINEGRSDHRAAIER